MLKDCPCCKGNHIDESQDVYPLGGYYAEITCLNSDCGLTITGYGPTIKEAKEDARRRWDRRAPLEQGNQEGEK